MYAPEGIEISETAKKIIFAGSHRPVNPIYRVHKQRNR